MDIISLLPHLAPILTDIIAKLPDYVSRINGFALFQILNNFPVEFSPRREMGRGRARDAKGILVSAAVLGTFALLLHTIKKQWSGNCSHWQIWSCWGLMQPCKYIHTHIWLYTYRDACKWATIRRNKQSLMWKRNWEIMGKHRFPGEKKKKQPPLPPFLFLLVLSPHYVKCIS